MTNVIPRIPVYPWLRVRFLRGYRNVTPYPYPHVPVTGNTRCYPYPCCSLAPPPRPHPYPILSNTKNASETAHFGVRHPSAPPSPPLPLPVPTEHQERAQNGAFLCSLIPFLIPLSPLSLNPLSLPSLSPLSLSPLSPTPLFSHSPPLSHSPSLSFSLYPLSLFPLLLLSPLSLSSLCVLSLSPLFLSLSPPPLLLPLSSLSPCFYYFYFRYFCFSKFPCTILLYI